MIEHPFGADKKTAGKYASECAWVRGQAISLGADPEFAIVKGTQLIPACEVLPGDTSWYVGRDGRSDTGEMRPAPHFDPLYVAASCREGLVAMAPLVKGLTVHAGHIAAGAPLGGHIHFRWQQWHENYREGNGEDWVRAYTPPVVYLNELFQALRERFESLDDAQARARGGRYGVFVNGRSGAEPDFSNVWRSTSHGGMEYRPPLSWLASPTVAVLYLTIGAQGFYDYLIASQMTALDPTRPSKFVRFLWNPDRIAANLKDPLPHYPDFLQERMRQVAEVFDGEIDWKRNIMETWEAI